MDNKEQIQEFKRRLDQMINNYVREFDLTYAELIGTLEITKQELMLKKDKTNERD